MSGAQGDWRPWLKAELEKLDCKVLIPEMPDIDTPRITKWVDHIANLVGNIDLDTYFIGHSIGCQAILRYLEKANKPIGGAIFVAGWFDLKNLEDEETKKIAKPWIKTRLNIKKIKKTLSQSILIISDNDPYDAFEYNKKKFTELGSKILVLHNAGHITKEDGFSKLPVLIDEFKKMLTI